MNRGFILLWLVELIGRSASGEGNQEATTGIHPTTNTERQTGDKHEILGKGNNRRTQRRGEV